MTDNWPFRLRLYLIIVIFLTCTHFGFIYYSSLRRLHSVKVQSLSSHIEIIASTLVLESSQSPALNESESPAPANVSTWPWPVVRGNLSEEQESIIEEERLLLQGELNNYNFQNRSLHNLLYEASGQPLRTIIFTTWRSGSNFLASILEQNAATFYYAEPLAHHDWVQFRNSTDGRRAIEELSDMFKCEYSNLEEYIDFALNHGTWTFDSNTRLGQHCQKSARARVCSNPEFLTRMCKLFPFQAIKIVRMRLNIARWLLEDPRWNARVIYLVRDPRGILQSRRLSLNATFCTGVSVCESSHNLCTDLAEDYETANEFATEFPERFMVVRYEELALDPLRVVKKIFEFSQWDFNYKIEKYVKEHTTHHSEGDFSVFRESNDVVFRWRDRLDWAQVNEIQSNCSTALTNWGYKLAVEQDNLRNFNPLGTFCLRGSKGTHN